MNPPIVLSFWAVSLLFVAIPGADWAYAIAAGLRHRSVVPAVTGMLAGHALATAIVVVGVGAAVSRMPGVLTVLTVTGAIYLVWLGVTTLRRPATIQAAQASARDSRLRQMATGLGVSGLNPKVFLLFLALLPQFVHPDAAWPASGQMLLLGALHVANCAVVYLLVGVSSQRLLRARPSAARIVSRVSGIAMSLIGVWLLVERLVLPH